MNGGVKDGARLGVVSVSHPTGWRELGAFQMKRWRRAGGAGILAREKAITTGP